MKPGDAFKISLQCIASVGAGSLLYLCFRPTSLAVFAWADAVDLTAEVLSLRAVSSSLSPFVPEFVISSLPGALWAYAFALAMGATWRGAPSRWSIPFLSTVPLLALGSEVGQGLGLVPGTFDPADLLFYAIAIFLGFATALSRPTSPQERPT